MNAQLSHLVSQQRIADLHRAAERARVPTSAAAGRRNSRDSHPVTRVTAQLAHLIARLAPTRLSGANHTARTPLAPDPVFDTGTPTGTSCADAP
jgi:hypothetical protein